MASDVKNILDDEKDALVVHDPLMEGAVDLQQPLFEEAEANFSKLSLHEASEISEMIKSSQDVSPLAQESVWFKQQQYESAETLYHMFLAGTAILRVAPGTPGKRHLVRDNRTRSKKQKHDQKTSPDFWNKKVKAEGASLLRTVKTVKGRLEELEKIQQRKSQMLTDAVSRVTVAVEECKTRLSEELSLSSGQINVFRSLLSEVEAVIDKTEESLNEKKEDDLSTQEKYYQKVTGRLSKLSKDLNSCVDLCNCFQPDVSKANLNHIVGEVSKFSLFKKCWNSDIFMARKEVLTNNIKSLFSTENIHPTDSESSLEGSCSDGTENGTETNLKTLTARANKSKKTVRNGKQAVMMTNRSDAKNMKSGRNKAKAESPGSRPNSGQNIPAAPIKRNSQGIQNKAGKRQDLFQFKGVSYPTAVPFLSQPGLLGPRPHVFPLQGTNVQAPFKFSHVMAAGQKQHPPNFTPTHRLLSAVNQTGFGNTNYNFSGNQPRTSPFIQNSVLASMNQQARSDIANQLKQSKLYQQDQTKGAKKSNRSFEAKTRFAYPQQQNHGSSVFLQKSQEGLMGRHSFRGDGRGNLEQQLNEMTQKIQQMQLDFSHNFKLQQLMKETERLKQLVSQKQHQQHDRFQQQFQLLINSFMQQQQQQQFQGPRSKMARAVEVQTTQKQQQQHNKQLQQYKKRKQHQNKVKQVKQEPQKQSLHEDAETDKPELENMPEPQFETVLQNGEDSFTFMGEKKVISENSKVTKIGTFSPQAQGDKHKAGVSSLVVMENIGCVVVVDIINSCLKLYNVSGNDASSGGLSHHLVTRLELSRPYYMGRLSKDKILVSREGKLLTLIRVSEKRLQFQQDIKTDSQYYGLGYVRENLVVCAAFTDNRIDLLSIKDGAAQTAVLLTQCKGPELVATVPSTGCILYLERSLNETVHLLGISQQSVVEFRIDLESSPGVWSIASISDKIVCCNKQSGRIKLYTENGIFLADMLFPPGDVNQPFAMTFGESGRMYLANDDAWDNEYNHYITTDINVYSFS